MSKYVHVCYSGPNSKRTRPTTTLVIAFGHTLTKRIHVVVASRTPFVIQNFAQLPLYATVLMYTQIYYHTLVKCLRICACTRAALMQRALPSLLHPLPHLHLPTLVLLRKSVLHLRRRIHQQHRSVAQFFVNIS